MQQMKDIWNPHRYYRTRARKGVQTEGNLTYSCWIVSKEPLWRSVRRQWRKEIGRRDDLKGATGKEQTYIRLHQARL